MRARATRLLIVVLFSSNFIFSILLYTNMSATQTPCVCSVATPAPCELVTSTSGTNKVERGHQYLLMILILSSPKTKNRRDAIRQTWMKRYDKSLKVQVKFSVGLEGLPTKEVENLKSENTAHGDLLLLENVLDSYHNLTRKVLESIVVLDDHYLFSYLMKCDDDTFVVLDVVLKELSERSADKSYYWGFFDGRAHVKRRGKWAEASWFLSDRYLPYALGGGYVLSKDLVRKIATNAANLALYNNEDVSVGVWLSPYRAERRHDVRFNTEFVSRGCRNLFIVSHKQSTEEMEAKQRLLDRTGKQCSREFQTRLSYIYNWTVETTKCCIRTRGVP